MTVVISENINMIKPYALGEKFSVLGKNNWSVTNITRSNWNTTGTYVTGTTKVTQTLALTDWNYVSTYIVGTWSSGEKSTTEDRVNATWSR